MMVLYTDQARPLPSMRDPCEQDLYLQNDDLEGPDSQDQVDVTRHLPAALAQPPKALP